MSRFLSFVVLLLAGLGLAETGANPLSLANLRDEVRLHNPEIAAAKARAAGREDAARAEKTLPSPEFTYERWGLGGGEAAEENWYGVMQKIPYPGKIAGRVRSMRHEAWAEEQHALQAEREAVAEAEEIFYDLAYVERALQIQEETSDLLRKVLKTLQGRYATGSVPQSDLLRAQTELSKTLNEILNLKRDRLSLRAELNAVMGRDLNAELGSPLLPEPKRPPPLEGLLEEAVKSRPDRMADHHHIEHLREEAKVAKLNYVPDLSVGYAYRTRPLLPDDSMVTVAVDLPFLWGGAGARAEASRHRLDEAKESFRATDLRVRAEVQRAWTEADTQYSRIELFRTTLVPQAEQARNVAERGYVSGQSRFLDFLDSQRTYLEVRLSQEDARRAYGRGVAELEQKTGKPVFGGEL